MEPHQTARGETERVLNARYAQRAERIREAIDSAPEISVLPQVVARVMDLASDISTSAAEIESVVSVDPGFSARLLRLANSAYFGLPRKVSSIKEAVVLLGGRNIRNLALTVSCYNIFIGKTDPDSLLRRELWRHSVLSAGCARSICAHTGGCPTEEGFAAGLLHDIGKTVLISRMPLETHAAIEFQRSRGGTSVDAELECMGMDHASVGAALAGRWNLPDILICAIENHHCAGSVQTAPERVLTASVALADSIVHMLESSARCPEEIPEDLSGEGLDRESAAALGIGEDDLSGVVMMLVGEIGNATIVQSLAA
jgi:putative nucleotidyltransferase with HDIG domain